MLRQALQFGKLLYVMVGRLSHCFVGDCSVYFRYLEIYFAETSDFIRVWGAFHLKSAGFHVKSKDLLQGKPYVM